MACSRKSTQPPRTAQVSGTLILEGLSAPVRVLRDRWGVPHIYAESRDDLFVAQGFVQAEDRLFQMDLWRRSVQGRLSQVLGANFIERDAMTRRVQYRGDLDAEWASYGPDAKAIAAAFVRGVNAWVALARERPPEEFALAGWTPEFWMPVDLLNRTDLFIESRSAIDFSTWRPAGTWRPASAGPDAVDVIADALRRVGAPPFFVGLAADVSQVRLKADATDDGGSRDSRGVRLQLNRASDQVVRLDHPSRRYLVHLNAPGWHVIGATMPWLPGVAIGHDDHAVWDMASVHLEAPAIEIVKVNPANPHQVDAGGRWVDTLVVKDIVIVKGRTEPFSYESDCTPSGVIVATDRERHVAFAMRWRGWERGALASLRALAADRAGSGSVVSSPSTRLGAGFSRTDRAGPAEESPTVVFAHPIGITPDARRRFNVGPLPRPAIDRGAFAIEFNASDWDQSTAMNAPGQSESPDSAHFADLAAQWAAGKSIPLPFSDRAVQSAAEATLILAPRRP